MNFTRFSTTVLLFELLACAQLHYSRNPSGVSFSADEEAQIALVAKLRKQVVSVQIMAPEKHWHLMVWPFPALYAQDAKKFGAASAVYLGDRKFVTNYHVIDGAASIVLESIEDGRGRNIYMNVVASDRKSDLAIIEAPTNVDFPDLLPATLGNLNELRAGQNLWVVGNPRDLGLSVTHGVLSREPISARGGSEDLRDILQTDASINPGNSGGGVFNSAGELVGIASMTLMDSVGLNYARPISLVKNLIALHNKGQAASWTYLGICATDIDFASAGAKQIPVRHGVYIVDSRIDELQNGDVVIAAPAGQPIQWARQLEDLILSKKPGDTLTLMVLRTKKNGGFEKIGVKITLKSYSTNKQESPSGYF